MLVLIFAANETRLISKCEIIEREREKEEREKKRGRRGGEREREREGIASVQINKR